MTEYPHLSSPLRLGSTDLRNRLVFCAHLTNYARYGLPAARHTEYYRARAAGGVGLIVTEEQSVHESDRPYEKMIRGHDPAVVPAYRQLTEAVHAEGARVLAQLNHNGNQSSGMYSRAPVWAPSPVPDPMFREVPKEIDRREIRELTDGYAITARHARLGGFDGVEIQASQASIMRAFLARATNLRTDEYGGSLRNRARFLLETIEAVRTVLGPDLVLGVRLSGGDFVPGGVELDEAVSVAALAAATGCIDYVNTSLGVATETLHMVEPSMAVPPGYSLSVAEAMRNELDVPVIGVGRFDNPEPAERAVAAGRCDLVGVVRGQIADPEFARKALGGESDTITTCLACNQDCSGRVGFGLSLGCVLDPRVGSDPRPTMLPTPTTFVRHEQGRRVVVVGGGPAGLHAAAAAANAGHRVALYERSATLGGQIRAAAQAPTRRGLMASVNDVVRECERLGVEIRTSAECSEDTISRLRPDVVVVATGARPSLPVWAAGCAGVVDVRDVLERTVEPVGRILVVDELGFHHGPGAAEFLAEAGCSVTICTSAMIVGQDLGVTLDLERWRARAHEHSITSVTDSVVVGCVPVCGGLEVSLLHHPTGSVQVAVYDTVVTARHPQPEDELWKMLSGKRFEVYRIGDVVAPRRLDAAVREGRAVFDGHGTVDGRALSIASSHAHRS